MYPRRPKVVDGMHDLDDIFETHVASEIMIFNQVLDCLPVRLAGRNRGCVQAGRLEEVAAENGSRFANGSGFHLHWGSVDAQWK